MVREGHRRAFEVFMLALALFVSWATAAGVARAEGSAAPGAEPKDAPPSADAPPGLPPGSELRLGPTSVDLPHDLTLGLPEGMLYGNHAFANELLRKNGSLHNEDVLGIVLPQDDDAQWWVILRFSDDGHVDDGEKLDANDILEALRDGLPELNEERKGLGMPPLAIDGWLEAPSYDQQNHRMLWALDVSSKDGHSANYNTRVLGRTGMLSLNLVTAPESLAADKRFAAELLAGTSFKAGHRYEDFQAKTDKLAEYGLTGLIAAGAGMGAVKLVKLGLLAKFGKVIFTVLLAAKKFVAVAAIAVFAFLKRLFGFGGASTGSSAEERVEEPLAAIASAPSEEAAPEVSRVPGGTDHRAAPGAPPGEPHAGG